MKKWLVFVLGVLTGIVLTFLFALLLSLGVKMNENNREKNNGVTMFDKPGDVLDVYSFKVFQVLGDDSALVYGKVDNSSYYGGAVYLLTNDEGKYYYDDEIVDVPKGGIVRHFGIYRYQNRSELEKTVPIIRIVDK